MKEQTPEHPLKPTGLCSVGEAAGITGYHPGHLRRLLETGLIEGLKIGKVWAMTPGAIEDYLGQDERRKPYGKRRSTD